MCSIWRRMSEKESASEEEKNGLVNYYYRCVLRSDRLFVSTLYICVFNARFGIITSCRHNTLDQCARRTVITCSHFCTINNNIINKRCDWPDGGGDDDGDHGRLKKQSNDKQRANVCVCVCFEMILTSEENRFARLA